MSLIINFYNLCRLCYWNWFSSSSWNLFFYFNYFYLFGVGVRWGDSSLTWTIIISNHKWSNQPVITHLSSPLHKGSHPSCFERFKGTAKKRLPVFICLKNNYHYYQGVFVKRCGKWTLKWKLNYKNLRLSLVFSWCRRGFSLEVFW